MFHGMLASKRWTENRASNFLDGGAPWYDTYETKDRKHVSIGSIEVRFYADLLDRLGIASEDLPKQHDRAGWPKLRERFTAVFKSRTRDEWCAAFETSDACFAPVLTWSEAYEHPHNVARKSFVEVGGVKQPAPAPRFSRTPGEIRRKSPERGEGGAAALADWGFDAASVAKLQSLGLGFAK
jgi:alpha-methylacyl-CoA racemase